ncbi:hypothetical protein XF35_01630 [Streptomyces platensis subsp. clarensis]|nr:hypothetical protein [Streptomyces platensis subsp. clarensis]
MTFAFDGHEEARMLPVIPRQGDKVNWPDDAEYVVSRVSWLFTDDATRAPEIMLTLDVWEGE